MKRYDYILPLGGFCGVAAQMLSRGLRVCALPFDWTLMTDEKSVVWLTSAFEKNFDDFFQKENLLLLDCDEVAGVAPYRYLDVVSGFKFLHHFNRPLNESYEEVAKTMHRRLERFLACLAPGRRCLMVLATPFGFDPALAAQLLEVVRARYSKTEIDLQVLQFNVQFQDPQIESRRFEESWPFAGAQYRRAHGLYDLRRTSSEWAFLDDVCISGSSKRRSWRYKFLYKIWKNLSLLLRKAGCGVLGIAFPVARSSEKGRTA